MIRSLLVFVLLANTLFAQPPSSPADLERPDIESVIQESAKRIAAAQALAEPVDIVAAIESVSTDEFGFDGNDLVRHFAEDHQGARLLKKLHEYLHQRIERLRPAGATHFVVVESTQQEFDSFMNGYGATLKRNGWPVIRKDKPIGQPRVANFVVINRTHYAHLGFLTRPVVQGFLDKSKAKMQKRVKWKISKIVMHTQSNCRPCERWKREEQPKAQADGVVIEPAPPNGNGTPWFEVSYCNDDQCRVIQFFEFTRYETMRDMQL